MANFDNGVARYIKAVAVVEVNFPVDFKGREEIACKHCQFYVRSTQRCGLNQQVVNYPEYYVGVDCPLEPIEEEEKTDV
jgi:hypothetical protein